MYTFYVIEMHKEFKIAITKGIKFYLYLLCSYFDHNENIKQYMILLRLII